LRPADFVLLLVIASYPNTASLLRRPTVSMSFDYVSADWLGERLGKAVKAYTMDNADLAKLNTTSCLRFATVEFADEESPSICIVIKMAAPSQMSQMHGLAREGYFYRDWRKLETNQGSLCELESILPLVFHSEGTMTTGEKLIVMQDLSSSCIQLGLLFGNGNPNNWGKVLPPSDGLVGVAEATRLAFSAAAKLHAPYWGSRTLVDSEGLSWLRGAAWMRGQDEAAWTSAQANLALLWTNLKLEKFGKPGYKVVWDPLLVAVVDSAIGKAAGRAGWELYQSELCTRPFTLVHGDFHPANLLLVENEEKVLLVDWEAAGVGSGPQELGQFMISHTAPTLRASIEREAVAAYYAELLRLNKDISMSLEDCWLEYVQGGLARWLFFLPHDGWGNELASQYFCDQVLAWIQDHSMTPANAPLPRL